MIDDLLEKINAYDRRVMDAWSRLNQHDYDDWDEDEDWEEYDDSEAESAEASAASEQDNLNPYDRFTGEVFFDESEEIIWSHRFRPDAAVRYTVSPDNPWYFDIDGVVFSRETGLLVRFPAEKGREYTVPEDERITGIGPFAFKGNTMLEKITFSSRVRYIGEKAFEYCSGLKEIEVPDCVGYLGSDVFSCCSSLKRAVLNCPVSTVPHRCFHEDVSLESVRYPDSVTEFVLGAFSGCLNLKDVRAHSETRTDYDVILSPSVTKIGGEAFCECEALQSVLLHENTKVIGMGAFMGCISLRTINTESVEEYGAYCFQDCVSLESLTFGSHTRKLGRLLLRGTDALKTIRFSCAPDMICAADALPEDKEYDVDTEAWLSVPRPYACRPLFFHCVRNIAEGEQVSPNAAAAAKKTMKRNRSKHYDWFLQNEDILYWALKEKILAGDDAVKMMKTAEADGNMAMTGMLGAWLIENFPQRLIDMMLASWEVDEPIRAAERAEAAQREKELLEEQERYRAEREQAVQEGEDLPLEDLDLRVSTYNSLKREGFDYLSEVVQMTVQELSPIRGLGLRGVNEIRQKMQQLEEDGKMTFPGQRLIYRGPSLEDFSVDDLLEDL